MGAGGGGGFAPLSYIVTKCPVILSGPSAVVNNINSETFNNSDVICTTSSLGDSAEVRLTSRKGTDNSMFMKASFLEEVLQRGFKLSSGQ